LGWGAVGWSPVGGVEHRAFPRAASTYRLVAVALLLSCSVAIAVAPLRPIAAAGVASAMAAGLFLSFREPGTAGGAAMPIVCSFGKGRATSSSDLPGGPEVIVLGPGSAGTGPCRPPIFRHGCTHVSLSSGNSGTSISFVVLAGPWPGGTFRFPLPPTGGGAAALALLFFVWADRPGTGVRTEFGAVGCDTRWTGLHC
jgi:hypothetical protein